MPRSIILASLACLLSLGPVHAGEAVDSKALLSAQTALALGLIDNTLVKEKSANVMVSPATLAAALGLAGLGASESGRAAIERCLGFADAAGGPEAVLTAMVPEKVPDPQAPLTTALAIVFDDKLKLEPSAVPMLAAHGVQPTIEDLDAPASVQKINGWVTDATRGAIPAILDSPPGGGFVSLGALSFKARWKRAFDPQSVPAPFRRPDGSSVEVPMMHLAGDAQNLRVDDRFAAVDLAYDGDAYRMVIVADRAGNGIAATDLKLLASWLRGEDYKAGKGDVMLPRFSLNDGRDLKPVLDLMGLGAAGDEASSFPGFSKDKINLARVLQKTMIRVDENGTEAAAATAAVAERSIETNVTRVVADARFAFALRDMKSGLILAAGLIGDPLLADNGP